MKPPQLLATLVLPLLVPMGLGAALIYLGEGPTPREAIADFDHPDAERRKEAFRWIRPLRRATLLDPVLPYLDPTMDEDLLEYPIEIVEKMKNPESLPHLEALMAQVDDRDLQLKILDAMLNPRYPHALPYLRRQLDHPDPVVAERARQNIINLRESLNAEVCFYSAGAPIYNALGHAIYSQMLLFEPGRELIGAPRAETGEVRVADAGP